MTRIIGIIPARYASSRFPGKPLLDLKGKTMIRRVYEGAGKSKRIDELIVATDDARVYDEVLSFGGKVMLTSPSHSTGTDRCGEVLRKVEADIVINIQGDEPLVDARQLDQLCEAFNDPDVNIATLGIRKVSEEDLHNKNRIKIVCNRFGDAIYFSRSAIPNALNASEEAKTTFPYRRHIGLYAYRASTLRELVDLEPVLLEKTESLEQLRWMYYGYKIRVIDTSIETPNIDVVEDVEEVLKLL